MPANWGGDGESTRIGALVERVVTKRWALPLTSLSVGMSSKLVPRPEKTISRTCLLKRRRPHGSLPRRLPGEETLTLLLQIQPSLTQHLMFTSMSPSGAQHNTALSLAPCSRKLRKQDYSVTLRLM